MTGEKYTAEQIEWLRENRAEFTYDELRRLFNIKFNETKTSNGIRGACVRNGLKRPNKRSIGSETKCSNNGKDDEIRIKVCNDPDEKVAWRLKQNVLWERYHNRTLPENNLVIFLNGDKTDFSKENLYAVSRRVHAIMAGGSWYSKYPELTFTSILLCELQETLKVNGLIGEKEQYGNAFIKHLR